MSHWPSLGLRRDFTGQPRNLIKMEPYLCDVIWEGGGGVYVSAQAQRGCRRFVAMGAIHFFLVSTILTYVVSVHAIPLYAGAVIEPTECR